MSKTAEKDQKNNIIKIDDPEIEALKQKITIKKERVQILRHELDNTLESLEEFSIQVNEIIAPLERRAADLKEKLRAALAFQKYSYKKEFPEEAFEQVEEEQEEEKAFQFEKEQRPDLNPEQKKKIKTLFRDLAKRFHPDLACDDEDKAWREETMTRINNAYQDQDLGELARLSKMPNHRNSETSMTRDELLTKLETECAYLDSLITDLEKQIKELDYSLAMQLKLEKNLTRQNGHDLLTDVARKLEEEIERLEQELATIGAPVDVEVDLNKWK